MKLDNSHYITTCKISFKLLLLIISSFFIGCSEQKEVKQSFLIENQVVASDSAINVNTASLTELEKLPQVGARIAQKIIEHREKYGKFRKPEFLMMVDGISDKRFREIKSLVKVE